MYDYDCYIFNSGFYLFVQDELKRLPQQDQDDITHILSCYHGNRNIYYLAQSLKNVFDTPDKQRLFPLLRQVFFSSQ